MSLSNAEAKAIAGFKEFANGGVVVSVRTKDGREFSPVLICSYKYICAVPGYDEPPFISSDIDSIWQSPEDKAIRRGMYKWNFFLTL